MTTRSLVIFFVTSVWLFIGLCAYKIIIHILGNNNILNSYPGGYGINVFIGPFLLITGEILLWFKIFRYFMHLSRMFAGFIGLYILIKILFVNIIVADIYNYSNSYIELITYGYAAVAHLAYSFFGKEKY